MQDFNQLLHRLADSGLEFVIVGGYAAVTHGSSLVTRDLDICAVLSEETVGKLRRILAEWHPKHRMTPDKLSFLEFPRSGPGGNLYLLTDVGVIGILSSVLGIGGFTRLMEAAEDFEIGGRTYHVMSLDDLLAAKELRAIAAKRREFGGRGY